MAEELVAVPLLLFLGALTLRDLKAWACSGEEPVGPEPADTDRHTRGYES